MADLAGGGGDEFGHGDGGMVTGGVHDGDNPQVGTRVDGGESG